MKNSQREKFTEELRTEQENIERKYPVKSLSCEKPKVLDKEYISTLDKIRKIDDKLKKDNETVK